MKTVLISGGSGFIGSHLCRTLSDLGWHLLVLTRNRHQAAQKLPSDITLIDNLKQLDTYSPVDILINLAGQSLADGRWSKSRKEQIINSRIGTTDALYNFFKLQTKPPEIVISGSAIGYYGADTGNDKAIAEDSPVLANFSQQLCADWEQSARQFEHLGSRVCYLRTGIVLGEQGALAKMLTPFKLGLGGPIGNGRQWMPWIHIEDIVTIILYCIQQDDLKGPVNGTAPEPVRNRDFVRILGAVLKRPALLPMPAPIVRLLFGQMGHELLLQGQRVIPKKLEDRGFQFKYTDLHSALNDLLT